MKNVDKAAEPSMEDILSSIRRIVADGPAGAATVAATSQQNQRSPSPSLDQAADDGFDALLDLVEAAPTPKTARPDRTPPRTRKPQLPPADDDFDDLLEPLPPVAAAIAPLVVADAGSPEPGSPDRVQPDSGAAADARLTQAIGLNSYSKSAVVPNALIPMGGAFQGIPRSAATRPTWQYVRPDTAAASLIVTPPAPRPAPSAALPLTAPAAALPLEPTQPAAPSVPDQAIAVAAFAEAIAAADAVISPVGAALSSGSGAHNPNANAAGLAALASALAALPFANPMFANPMKVSSPPLADVPTPPVEVVEAAEPDHHTASAAINSDVADTDPAETITASATLEVAIVAAPLEPPTADLIAAPVVAAEHDRADDDIAHVAAEPDAVEPASIAPASTAPVETAELVPEPAQALLPELVPELVQELVHATAAETAEGSIPTQASAPPEPPLAETALPAETARDVTAFSELDLPTLAAMATPLVAVGTTADELPMPAAPVATPPSFAALRSLARTATPTTPDALPLPLTSAPSWALARGAARVIPGTATPVASSATAAVASLAAIDALFAGVQPANPPASDAEPVDAEPVAAGPLTGTPPALPVPAVAAIDTVDATLAAAEVPPPIDLVTDLAVTDLAVADLTVAAVVDAPDLVVGDAAPQDEAVAAADTSPVGAISLLALPPATDVAATNLPVQDLNPSTEALVPVPATVAQAAGPRSLEDTVVELLRPMLRSWIDTNMPVMVEKALRAETSAITPPIQLPVQLLGKPNGAPTQKPN